jgi:hypothetical protein
MVVGARDGGLETDWAEVQEIAFPLGPRQVRRLQALHPQHPPRSVFAALHAGVLRAVLLRAHAEGATAKVAAWIGLEDQAGAAEYLARLPDTGGIAALTSREILDRWAGQPIGDVYCAALPADLRHRMGEYYTPQPLVDKILKPLTGGIVADPACGDGRFLVTALESRAEDEVWGCDLNPLAVAMSRYEVWRALGRPAQAPSVTVQWADFLLDGRAAPAANWPPAMSGWGRTADHFVGNPPWVLWRNLSDGYRSALAKVFGRTALHQASGWGARVAAGQTDLAHLFLHESVERVSASGTVTYVLPRTVFTSPVGPSVIRSGKTVQGRHYAYTKVLECPGGMAFDGVRLLATVAHVQADRMQRYPVEWIVLGEGAALSAGPTRWVAPARPDDERSGWVAGGEAVFLADDQVPAQLVARGGVNTGGGNGVFHVDVLGRDDAGTMVVVRNRPVRGFPARVVEAAVEEFVVRPLLKGSDISAWHAEARMSILLPHDPGDLRKAMTPAELSRTAPGALRYLELFRSELAGRPELARWGGVWYSLFRIGPYTTAPWRVVWPTSAGGSMRAAVLSPDDFAVPDQKVVLVPFEEPLPAHFLCALLNSGVVRRAIRSGSALDASPNLTRRVPLPRWNPQDESHAKIAALSVAAHAASGIDEECLNALVSRIYRNIQAAW